MAEVTTIRNGVGSENLLEELNRYCAITREKHKLLISNPESIVHSTKFRTQLVFIYLRASTHTFKSLFWYMLQ